jgi:hypothetical protein
MTPRTFAHLLDLRGPALERWPGAEREAARALLARSAAARRLFLAAADPSPGGPPDDPADDNSLMRLAEAVARTPQRAAVTRSTLRTAGGWAALAAAAALGAWLGQAPPGQALHAPPALLAALEPTPFASDAP